MEVLNTNLLREKEKVVFGTAAPDTTPDVYPRDNVLPPAHEGEKPQNLPVVFFHSSPRIAKLTLEAQGVLLYNAQKQ